MVAAFDYCLHGKGGAAPSIDTAMHGAGRRRARRPPAPGLRDRARDRRRRGGADRRRCFGDRVVWVPWRRPGFQLGLDIAAIKAANPQAIGCILGGHGITAWGDTSERGRGATRWRSSAPREAFLAEQRHRPSRSAPWCPATSRCPTAERRARAAALAPVIRGLASTDQPQVGHYTDSDVVLDFLSREKLAALAELGTSCPDHFLRTKVKPLVVDLPGDAPLEEVVARLHGAARGVPRRLPGLLRPQRRPRTARRSAAPTRRSCWSRASACSRFGKDKQTARVAGEFYVNAINVMRGAEAVSHLRADRRGGEVPHRVLGAGGGQARADAEAEAAGHPGRAGHRRRVGHRQGHRRRGSPPRAPASSSPT